jgi:3,4-dihydroxy 2-butanone 4-phosphate synthase/GTP cyclohydrolase II
MRDDGEMARLPELLRFARKHKLRICSIEALIEFRRAKERLVERVESIQMPTDYGDFQLKLYRSTIDGQHHLALVKGDVAGKKNVLVRVHSECLTGDVFGSRRCDCGPQLHQAMKQIADAGQGVIVYMRQEGRGIGHCGREFEAGLSDGSARIRSRRANSGGPRFEDDSPADE